MPEPLLAFRPPVRFEPAVVARLCTSARRGYEARHKRETFGFLCGSLEQTGRLLVRRAVFYRGGSKSRTGICFTDWPSVLRVLRRRSQIARRSRLRFLGNFHSHVEIAGSVFRGLSESDRRSFRHDTQAALEALVFVWAGPRPARTQPKAAIMAFEPETGYDYRIRLYAKRRAGIRRVGCAVSGLGTAVLLDR